MAKCAASIPIIECYIYVVELSTSLRLIIDCNAQAKTVIEDVNRLLEKYLRQRRTIILAVIPSNVDIATVDILERANHAEIDP